MFLAQIGQQIDALHGLPHHFRHRSCTDRGQSLVLAAAINLWFVQTKALPH